MTRTVRPAAVSTSRPARSTHTVLILALAASAAALVGGMVLSVGLGALPASPGQVLGIVVQRLSGISVGSWTPAQATVVWELRLPRAILGALVGAGLAVAGTATQALVRNPLADPYVLGLTYGAAVGAVFVIVTGLAPFGSASTSIAAFAGALATFGLVFALARRGGSLAPLRLVLCGMAVTYGLFGLTSFLILQADDQGTTNSVLFWLFGSLAEANWNYLGLPAAVLVAAMVLLGARARSLNALLMGDETASSLGITATRTRGQLFATIALLTAVMVALAGGIGFLGLVIPHAARLVVGSDHRRLLPVAALSGAAFMVLVDVAARLALRPQELPVGIVTAFIGAPLFLWLVHARARDTGGL